MKAITIRSQIRELPDELRRVWQLPNGSWKRIGQPEPDTEKIHAAVSALNLETAPPEDVQAAMQFPSGWIRQPKCDECGREVDVVVQLGEPLDYESSTANVCIECLRAAIKVARTEKP